MWPWNWGLGSLKVIESGTIRQSTYDVIFICYSKYASIYYRFRDIAAYWSNIATPLYLAPPLGVKPSYATTLGAEKTRMMGLSDGERISMIRWAVLIQYTRLTDEQTELAWHIRTISRVIKNAIKLAIKLDIIAATTSSCKKSPARLAQLLQPSLALFFLQPMTAYQRVRWGKLARAYPSLPGELWIVIACAWTDGTPSLAARKIMLMRAATVLCKSCRTFITGACFSCNNF